MSGFHPYSSRTEEAIQIQALLCPLTTTPGAVNIDMDTAFGAIEPALNETHRPDTVPGKETERPRNPSKIANSR
jgi:hypothetical protein